MTLPPMAGAAVGECGSEQGGAVGGMGPRQLLRGGGARGALRKEGQQASQRGPRPCLLHNWPAAEQIYWRHALTA